MIGYRISRADLLLKVAAESRTWTDRAKTRTAECRRAKKFADGTHIWSDIKPVYMRLQGASKCAYCERKLESEEFGLVEQDVEHYRPKNGMRDWHPSQPLVDEGVSVTPIPNGSDVGYHLLAFDVSNYCASCKPCNSTLKSNFFPVSGKYFLGGTSPKNLLRERPFLIYPVGDFDENPEDLVQFIGVSPCAVIKSGHRRLRALVTIEFFRLNDSVGRRNLFVERARMIVMLFPQLQAQIAGARTVADDVVEGATADHAPHANCARSFVRLYRTNPIDAQSLFNAAVALIQSSS